MKPKKTNSSIKSNFIIKGDLGKGLYVVLISLVLITIPGCIGYAIFGPLKWFGAVIMIAVVSIMIWLLRPIINNIIIQQKYKNEKTKLLIYELKKEIYKKDDKKLISRSLSDNSKDQLKFVLKDKYSDHNFN